MWDWLKDNVDLLQVVVSVISAAVWIAYLHVFVASFRRQTRSSLMISPAGDRGMAGRCIVSNMGSEPAYLIDVLAEFEAGKSTNTVSIVDRLEISEEPSAAGGSVSAVGPIASGSYVDVGSFDDLFRRACKRLEATEITTRTEKLTLIAIAATGQARDIVAAYRSFDFEAASVKGGGSILPREVSAVQVGSWRERRRLANLLGELQRKGSVERHVLGEVVGASVVPWK